MNTKMSWDNSFHTYKTPIKSAGFCPFNLFLFIYFVSQLNDDTDNRAVPDTMKCSLPLIKYCPCLGRIRIFSISSQD